MSGRHLHREVIIALLKMAKAGHKAWDKLEHHQWAADDFHQLGEGIAHLADERDEARTSAQKMHKRARATEDDLGAARMTIRRLEAKLKDAVKMLSEQEFAANRRSNDMIHRHAAQIVALRGNGLFPLGAISRVEVIDHNGRSYTNVKVKEVELSLQDNDRTLKVFLK